METLLKQPETKIPSAETEKSQEQTPEQFRKSLEIFNSYKEVSAEEATQPEFTMRFDEHEQDLVAGLRGALNEFIDETAGSSETVSIASMFDRLDAAIRTLYENADEETLDQLYLVATKMRYNLQVRYDRSQRTADTKTSDSGRPNFDWSRSHFVADEPIRKSRSTGGRRSGFSTAQTNQLFDEIVDQFGDDTTTVPKTPPTVVTPQAAIPPSLEVQAHEQVMKYTGGRTFDSLDTKEQGRVTKQMAKDFHPDIHPEKESIYKEMASQTDRNRNQAESKPETSQPSQPEQ
jgi:hypothetical protein